MLDQPTHAKLLSDLATRWLPVAENPNATLAIMDEVSGNYSLRGPHVRGVPPQFVGRVQAFSSFTRNIQKSLRDVGIAVTIDHLDTELRSIVATFPVSPTTASSQFRNLLLGIRLSRNPAWCAFVNPDRDSYPFVPPRNTAGCIRNALGLGCLLSAEEFLAFAYDPRPNYVLRCPTIADAGSYQYFEPAVQAAEHGWTKPLDTTQPEGLPQPEAVHQALLADAEGLIVRTII